MIRHFVLALGASVACVAFGCSDGEKPKAAVAPTVDAGSTPTGCAPGTVPNGDKCDPPGILRCGQGFVSDERGGCNVVLPRDPCPKGKMALPGETECRDIAPCAPGTWGDLPDGPTTKHVDGSVSSTTGDGTRDNPFKTISAAVVAAASGDTIAIAAGHYEEAVVVRGKALSVRGVCPATVEIRTTPTSDFPSVLFADGSAGSALSGVGITSPTAGLMIGGGNVTVDHVWIHDVKEFPFAVASEWGPTAATVRGSLFESNFTLATMLIQGGDLVVEDVVIRNNGWLTDGRGGRALSAEPDAKAGTRASNVTMRRAVIERNGETAIFIEGSSFVFEDSVIRDQLSAPSGVEGRGITAQRSETGGRPNLVVKRSVIERNREVGVVVQGGDIDIEDSVIRDTTLNRYGRLGTGIQAAIHPGTLDTATMKMRRCVVSGNHQGAVSVVGGTAEVEATIIRDTLPEKAGTSGVGMVVQFDEERLGEQPFRATGSIKWSRVENNYIVGLATIGSIFSIEGVLIEGTKPRESDGAYGDAISVIGELLEAKAEVRRTIARNNTRAGISNFGGVAFLEDCSFECNGFDLNGEMMGDRDFSFDSRGKNRCGCETEVQCRAVSESLAPPAGATGGK